MNFLVTSAIQGLLPQWQYDLYHLDKTCGKLRKFDFYEIQLFWQSKQYEIYLLFCGSEVFNGSVSFSHRVRRINSHDIIITDPISQFFYYFHSSYGTFKMGPLIKHYTIGYRIEKIYPKK